MFARFGDKDNGIRVDHMQMLAHRVRLLQDQGVGDVQQDCPQIKQFPLPISRFDGGQQLRQWLSTENTINHT